MKKGAGLSVYAILYLVFLYAPIAILPVFAFNNSQVVAFPLKGFTTQWFGEMWADANLRSALFRSLVIAFSSASIATILGLFAARASVRYNFPGKTPAMGLIMLPMVLPDIVVAMALLIVLLSLSVPLSMLTIILGHVLLCMPFAVASVESVATISSASTSSIVSHAIPKTSRVSRITPICPLNSSGVLARPPL